MLGFEDPCIALVLNFPSDKEGKRSDGFAVWHVGTPHILPLKVNREAVPLVWLYIGDAQPFLIVAPTTKGVSTLDEQVENESCPYITELYAYERTYICSVVLTSIYFLMPDDADALL
jgi:hypothetical protein